MNILGIPVVLPGPKTRIAVNYSIRLSAAFNCMSQREKKQVLLLFLLLTSSLCCYMLLKEPASDALLPKPPEWQVPLILHDSIYYRQVTYRPNEKHPQKTV